MARYSHHDLRLRFNPESFFGGYSQVDFMVEFYGRIASLIRPSDRVLDFGAGRGAQIAEDTIPYRRNLKILKGRVAHVEGCDIDEEVMNNPYLDGAKTFSLNEKLPYDDNSFDLIFSNWVFEHIENPEHIVAELLRILKPGGYVCAITPNKFGYIAMASRLIANRYHTRMLRNIQPTRKDIDVFPTFYRLNSAKAIEANFGKYASRVVIYNVDGDPAYHFNSLFVFGLFRIIHAITPKFFKPVMITFIQKSDR